MTAAAPDRDPIQTLSALLGDDLQRVDALINERAASSHVGRIGQIANHLVNAGGKRIRPLLTLATARLAGAEGPNRIYLAAALEFIHTTTLLHDDVVDMSSRRRGKPTANLLWDNKTSILVGDFFFARAFQLMVATRSLETLSVLSDTSATISEAEVLQLAEIHNTAMSEDTYFRIIQGKTGALFAAAARVGIMAAGGGGETCAAAERFGHALGNAYQIRDDVLDYGGAAERLGKNVGDDFRDRKVTLPVIRAMQAAGPEERDFWNRAIGEGRQADGDLQRALALLDEGGALARVQDEAAQWAECAKRELAKLPRHPLIGHLERLAHFAAHRAS